MKMSPNNLKQAEVITGAVVLPNANGSAPGQWVSGKYEGNEKIIMLLPGPPHEIKPLFDEQCMDRLRAKLPPQFIATRVLKIGLMAESQADARVAPIYKRYTDVQTTILAGAGEIQLHLKTRAESLAAAQARVDQLAEEIEEELGDAVFSDNGDSIEQIVGYYLQMRDATLAVAESCTGGLLAERITSVSGSSRYFVGGAVVYSNEHEDRVCRCSRCVDRKARRSQRRGCRRTGRRHPRTLRRDPGPGNHRRRRTDRRYRAKTGWPGLSCSRVCKRNRSRGKEISRRPQTHPLVRQSAGAGHGEKKIDVRQSSVVGRQSSKKSSARLGLADD